MDIGSLSTGLAQGAVAQQIDLGVLKSVQNLDRTATADLFASIGLGSGIDAYA